MGHDSYGYKEGHLLHTLNVLKDVSGRCKEVGANITNNGVRREISGIVLCGKYPQ